MDAFQVPRLPPPSSSTDHIADRCQKHISMCGKCCPWRGDTMGGRSPRTQHPSTPSRPSQCSPASQSKRPFDVTSQRVHRVPQPRVEFLEALQKNPSFLPSWAQLLWRRTEVGGVSEPVVLFTESGKRALKRSRPQQERWETVSPRFRASRWCLLLPFP